MIQRKICGILNMIKDFDVGMKLGAKKEDKKELLVNYMGENYILTIEKSEQGD